jgi:hypothetical protein
MHISSPKTTEQIFMKFGVGVKLAQNRDQWWDVVNTVVNLWVP